MTKYQLFIVGIMAAIVIGGGGYLAYDALYPYRHIADELPPRYVPPIVLETEKAWKLRADGKLAEAQKLLRKQLRIHGKRPEAKAARDLLGEINTEMFFSLQLPFGKTEYVVKRGDTLWRIARKLDSTPQVIMRTNNLESDRLQPGDRLLVPDLEFTVTLDLPGERAVVHTGDGFFKQYPIVSFNLPRPIRQPITTKVKGATFWKEGTHISNPSEEDRAAGTPWLHLATGGYTLYGVSDEEGVADSAVEITDASNDSDVSDKPPRGIALLKDDLAELQLLIDRGTPVTIIGKKP